MATANSTPSTMTMRGGVVMPTTVYPSRACGFPPASFMTFADALGYVRQVSDSHPPCGICTCPVCSYFMHYGDTIK